MSAENSVVVDEVQLEVANNEGMFHLEQMKADENRENVMYAEISYRLQEKSRADWEEMASKSANP